MRFRLATAWSWTLLDFFFMGPHDVCGARMRCQATDSMSAASSPSAGADRGLCVRILAVVLHRHARGSLAPHSLRKHASQATQSKSRSTAQVGSVDFDRQGIADHAQDLASNIAGNLGRSLESIGVDLLLGTGKFVDAHTVEYKKPGRVDVGGTVTAKNIIIASGSVPFVPPGALPRVGATAHLHVDLEGSARRALCGVHVVRVLVGAQASHATTCCRHLAMCNCNHQPIQRYTDRFMSVPHTAGIYTHPTAYST